MEKDHQKLKDIFNENLLKLKRIRNPTKHFDLEDVILQSNRGQILYESKQGRAPIDLEHFEKANKKDSGVSEGFIAQSKEGHTYMIKVANIGVDLRIKKDQEGLDQKERDKIFQQNKDTFREYIASEVYDKLLYGKSSTVELVKGSDKNLLLVRSKFLDEFQDIQHITGGDTAVIGSNNLDDLNKVPGFEKVMAANLMLGEVDWHAGNLGIVHKGKENENFVKIDHGRSLLFGNDEFKDEFAIRNALIQNLHDWYGTEGYEGIPHIGMDAKRLKESIDYMIEAMSVEEFTKLVAARIYQLQKAGVDFSKLGIDGINTGEDYAKFFAEGYKANVEKMQKFSENLGLIIAVDPKEIGVAGDWLKKDSKQNFITNSEIFWKEDVGKGIEEAKAKQKNLQQNFSKAEATHTQKEEPEKTINKKVEQFNPKTSDVSNKKDVAKVENTNIPPELKAFAQKLKLASQRSIGIAKAGAANNYSVENKKKLPGTYGNQKNINNMVR